MIYTKSAIFQCFLTATYPTIAARIKPTGMIKIPMLSIFKFLQVSNILVQFRISHKYCKRYQNKNKGEDVTVVTVFFQETDSICTKTTSDCYQYQKLFIQAIHYLVYQVYFFFFIQNSNPKGQI